MNERQTDVAEFLGECNAGILLEKLALALSDAALAQVTVAEKGKKAQVGLSLTFQRMGDNNQVIISHKITTSIPTKRGKKAEEDTTETAFFVAKGGKLSISPPKEDLDGQFSLTTSVDTKTGEVRRIS